MVIKSIKLENVTVFEDVSLNFSEGINVLIGENATGKTHLLKILYSACRSGRSDVDFGYKIVRTMMPDEFRLSRLITKKSGSSSAKIRVTASENGSNTRQLVIAFDDKTKKWAGNSTGKDGWEEDFADSSSIFIPAKEILSNSYKLAAATSVDNVRFDDTYIDIINSAKIDISLGTESAARSVLLRKIEKMTGGKVAYDDKKDEFYLVSGRSKQEFNLIAEGIKKMGLLWVLAKNGTLEKGSVLFWDEPEANINPAYISIIAELLLELQRNGVQIFLSTHNYFLAKYLEIKQHQEDIVSYFSLYRTDDKKGVSCEQSDEFSLLSVNPIIKTYIELASNMEMQSSCTYC